MDIIQKFKILYSKGTMCKITEAIRHYVVSYNYFISFFVTYGLETEGKRLTEMTPEVSRVNVHYLMLTLLIDS